MGLGILVARLLLQDVKELLYDVVLFRDGAVVIRTCIVHFFAVVVVQFVVSLMNELLDLTVGVLETSYAVLKPLDFMNNGFCVETTEGFGGDGGVVSHDCGDLARIWDDERHVTSPGVAFAYRSQTARKTTHCAIDDSLATRCGMREMKYEQDTTMNDERAVAEIREFFLRDPERR